MSTTPQHKTSKPKVAATLATCRSAFISVGFFSLFINLLMLTGPLFMLQVYDRVLASKSLPTLTALVILIAALFLFLGLLEMVRTRILARILPPRHWRKERNFARSFDCGVKFGELLVNGDTQRVQIFECRHISGFFLAQFFDEV